MIYGTLEKGWLIKGEVAFPPKELCVDWTDVKDQAKWRWLVEKRHRMSRELLTQGKIIKLTSKGKSLEPLMWSGATFELRPMGGGYTVKVGDIVFCEVQPGNRCYIHLVWYIEEHKDDYDVWRKKYYIGNNKEGMQAICNGWCYADKIFGYVPQDCLL